MSSTREATLGKVAAGDQSMRGSHSQDGRFVSSTREASARAGLTSFRNGLPLDCATFRTVPLMRLISSKLTLWNKRWMPLCWFGLLAIATVVLAVLVARGRCEPAMLLIPAGAALASFLYMKFFTFVLADEVWDAGDILVIKNGSGELRLPVANIKSVHYSMVADPPRITLVFRTSVFPEVRVQFMPHFFPGMFLFRKHPLVAELTQRGADGQDAAGRRYDDSPDVCRT